MGLGLWLGLRRASLPSTLLRGRHMCTGGESGHGALPPQPPGSEAHTGVGVGVRVRVRVRVRVMVRVRVLWVRVGVGFRG